jgi:hypothetical protein
VRRLLPAAALVAALAAAASADEVRLKDGRLLEGKVLEESASEVKVRLRFGGDVTLRRDEVQSIERKDLPEEALAKRRAALDPKDAEGRWRLAREAKEQKLRKAYEELVDEVLRLDPAHAGANEARGRVLFEGKWMKPAERDALEAARERDAKAAQGLVEYKGRWVTPEEKEALERGLVKKDGRWMTEREAREMEGLVEYKGGWVRKEELESFRLRDALIEAAGVPLNAVQSERFQVFGVYTKAELQQVLEDAEKTYAEFAGIFGVKTEERLFNDIDTRAPSRCTIVVLEKDAQYQKFIDGFLRVHERLKKNTASERIELWRRQKGFHTLDPDCWIVGYQFPYPKEHTRHTVVHKLSHMLLQRWKNKGTAWTNWWLQEGLGEVQEVNAFGSCLVYCITSGYGQTPGEDKGITESWKSEAKMMAAGGGDRRLQDLFVLNLNDLEPHDLVKCWSFVHYLLALDREKFARMTVELKSRKPASEVVPALYGQSLDQLDGQWREFVKRTY